MNDQSRHVQTVYLTLMLLHTLAASFIWGINTLFLLDAGLSNAQAFAANAFFTAGQVLFEVPTGVTADVRGRRFSYLLGTLTLTVATLLYLLMWRVSAPFWAWALALVFMRDIGFTPQRGSGPLREIRRVLAGSIEYGLRRPPVRWVMLASAFVDGVSIYAFYAMQPYLLELYGDPKAYGVAGLAAAIVGGAQIGGGLLVPRLRRAFDRRTSVLLTSTAVGALVLAIVGSIPQIWVAVVLMLLWGLVFATVMPVRQAFVNGLIPSEQRATVLSFDSLMGSAGGVVFQPVLGKTADVWGYPASYLCSAAIQTVAVPLLWLARRERAESDPIPDQDT